jgi:predicted Zn-dependent protease
MPRYLMPRYLAIMVLALSATACVVNPVTHREEFSLVSAQQEVAIGSENYAPSQQAQGGRYNLDPGVQTYVAEVGRKLAAVSDRPDLPYEFVVLNNTEPNAWALPGGKIAVNRGLLIYLEDESQLAAVLAHEIVHAAARHSAAQMTRGTLLGAVAQIVGIASQQSGFGELGGMAAQLGSSAWLATYGRGAELEADAYGMDYMARAGYDANGAVKLQQTFVKLSEGKEQDAFSSLFTSHPPSQERVDANLRRAQDLPSGGIVNAKRFQSKTARIRQDEPAYKEQEKAIKALNDEKPDVALGHLDKAINLQPKEAQFWELRGHALAMQKNPAEAERAFSAAIDRNADYFRPFLGRGILRFKAGNNTAAKPDLERSLKLLPTAPATFYLGEIALAANDRDTAAGYYRRVAQDSGEIGKAARARLASLQGGVVR